MKMHFTKKYLTFIVSCISIIFCSSFSQATQDDVQGSAKTRRTEGVNKSRSLNLPRFQDASFCDSNKTPPKGSEHSIRRSQEKKPVPGLVLEDLKVEVLLEDNQEPGNPREGKKKRPYEDLESSHEKLKGLYAKLKESHEKKKAKNEKSKVIPEILKLSNESLKQGKAPLNSWDISKNKIAFITGSSRGIGRALTEALLASGIDVIGVARNKEALEGFAIHHSEKKSTSAALGNFRGIVADLSSGEGQDAVAPAVESLLGNKRKLEYIVFNAAIITPVGYEALFTSSPGEIRKSIETNLLSSMVLTNTLYSLSEDDARTLIVSSVAGDRPGGGTLFYSTTKAAVDRVVSCLRKDQGLRAGSPSPNDLWKNRLFASVNPGNVETDIHSVDLRGADPEAFPRVEYFKEMEGRLTSPDVAAKYIKWLLTNATREQFLEYEKHTIYNLKHQEYWTPGNPVLDPYATLQTTALSTSLSLSTTSSTSSPEPSPVSPRRATTRSASSTDLPSLRSSTGDEAKSSEEH